MVTNEASVEDRCLGNMRFSVIGTETLTMPSYGIITGAENTVTAVTARRHTFIIFRTVLPAT